MEGGTELIGRGAVEEAEVIEATEGVGVLLAVEEEADGGFASKAGRGELPAAGATKELEIVVGEFVETADKRVADVAGAETEEGVEKGVLEGGAAVDVGGVVSVALEVDGDGGAEDVVGGLHEVGGLEVLLTVVLDGVEEAFGVLDAAEAGAADDGIGLLEVGVAEGEAGEDDGAAQQGAHAPGYEWRDVL